MEAASNPEKRAPRKKNRIQKRRKPKMSDFITTNKNILHNYIQYKGQVLTIVQTKMDEEEKQKYPDRIRYWPLKKLPDLKNRVRPGSLDEEEDLHSCDNDKVQSEKPKSTGEYEVKKRGAKSQGTFFYTELDEEIVSPKKSVLIASSAEENDAKSSNEPEYEVEAIIDKKVNKCEAEEVVEYQVLWKGYPREEATWEKASNLGNCRDLIEEYEGKNA